MIRSFLILLSFLVTCCGNTQPSVNLNIEPYRFENNKGEVINAELGSFQVPENRTNPNSKLITMRFVRFKSTNPNPGSPIVYLAGGPGGSGISTAKGSRYKLFMSMRSVADVIAYDQRGTGMSDGPSEYPGFWTAEINEPLIAKTIAPKITEAVQTLAAHYKENGTDLSGYNSNESADDLNDLRIALGADKINLWGISYGTHLALTTLKRHERHIDRLILAGIEGYDHTVKMPNDQQELLEDINDLILANPKTAQAYPDFLGDIKKVLDQLDHNPVIVEAKHPFTGQIEKVTIGKLDVQILLSSTLRGPSMFNALPYMIHQMKQGDFSSINDYVFYTKFGQYNAMSSAMDLASGISKNRLDLLKKQAKNTLLGDAINFPYLIEYQAMKNLDLGDKFRAPYKSNKSVLCISGTLDGRTPVNNAIETLKYLPNGKHLIIDGAGHSDPLFLSSPRIEEVMLAFMNGETVKDETIKLAPIEFHLPDEN